jgi:hypothetical protein
MVRKGSVTDRILAEMIASPLTNRFDDGFQLCLAFVDPERLPDICETAMGMLMDTWDSGYRLNQLVVAMDSVGLDGSATARRLLLALRKFLIPIDYSTVLNLHLAFVAKDLEPVAAGNDATPCRQPLFLKEVFDANDLLPLDSMSTRYDRDLIKPICTISVASGPSADLSINEVLFVSL